MTTKQLKTILEMSEQGASLRQIADAVGCSYQYAWEVRKGMGIKTNGVGRPEKRFKIVRRGGGISFSGTSIECARFLQMGYKSFLNAAKRGHTRMFSVEEIK